MKELHERFFDYVTRMQLLEECNEGFGNISLFDRIPTTRFRNDFIVITYYPDEICYIVTNLNGDLIMNIKGNIITFAQNFKLRDQMISYINSLIDKTIKRIEELKIEHDKRINLNNETLNNFLMDNF
jgi:hypothetical protein